MTTFRFNHKRLADLSVLCAVTEDDLDKIAAAVNELEHNVNPRILLATLKAHSNEDIAQIIMQLVMNIASYSRAYEENLDALVEQFKADLTQEEGWFDEHSADCQKVFIFLKNIVNSHSVNLVAKTLDISSNYGSLATDIAITTDMRPVFNTRHDGMVGSIIVSTLYMELFEGGEATKKTVTLHLDDLKKLQSEVNRAIDKIEVVKKSMSPVLKDNFYVPGEEQNGS